MEAGGESYFAMGIDAEKRNASLDIVRDAVDTDELLHASRDHFDTTSSLLDSDRVLAEFQDDELGHDLKNTEGFDPELFKACLLFELSHTDADDSAIPEYVQVFAEFWKGNPDYTREYLERTFTAETKRSRYEPFPVMSDFIVQSIALQTLKQYFPLDGDTHPSIDPLQEEIDGQEPRFFMGGEELTFDEPPVLTRQLQRDLRKFVPGPVVDELRYRFPDDAAFEEINGYIERIKNERAHDTLPQDDELLACFRRLGRRAVGMTGDANELEMAKDFFADVHRSVKSRLMTRDVYVPEVGGWYVVQVLESETECNVFYRRTFYGDITTKERNEVPIDQRQPVLDELERERQAVKDFPGSMQQDGAIIHDVIGSYRAT